VRHFRSLIYRLDPIRSSASVLKENQTGYFEVEQTINQLLWRTMQLIVQVRTIEFPVGLFDTENTPRSHQPTGSSWYAPLSIGRTNRRTYLANFTIRVCRDRSNPSIPSQRPVCYCKETTGIGRLLQCCCSYNVREQTACTVISDILFRVSLSMRMRPGGISCGWKL